MTQLPLNLTVVRILAAIGAFFVVAVIALVVLAAILRGSSLDQPEVVTLITSIGVLITLAVSLVGAVVTTTGVSANTQQLGQVQQTVDQVHEQVNGHLQAHTQLTADNIQALVDEAVARRLAAPPTTEEKSA